jgi:integrase
MAGMGRHKTVQTQLPKRMRRIRNAYYYDHGVINGKRCREPLGSDYREALRRWAEIESGSPTQGTVGAILVDYRDNALPRSAPRTQRDRRGHIQRLERVFGRMAAADLEPHHIATYLRRHSYPVAANREIETLSAALSWGVEHGAIRQNVARQVRRNREAGRDRRVTDAEYQAVYALAPPSLQVAMELAVTTGMRRGDLLALSWAQVSDDGIKLRQEKTGTALLLEWTPRLTAAIEHARAIRPRVRGMTVLCTRRGQPYSRDGFSAMWQRLMAKAVANGVERFTFHDLRAKCATEAKAAGLDSQALLGHRTEAQHQTYLRSREVRRVRPL